MKVGLSILQKRLLVTILTDDAAAPVDPESMLEMEPGTRLGCIPYERLRALGDGVHELFDQEDWRVAEQVEDGRFKWGDWLGLACLPIIGVIAGYWGLDHWETHGGRIRIHWAVAMIYAFGGKTAVAGVFGAVALGCVGAALWTYAASQRYLAKKRQQIRDVLEEMFGENSRITFSSWPTRQRLFVRHQAGEYVLFLPEHFLTDAETKRAVGQFGEPHLGEPDPRAETVPSGFVESLGTNLDDAADRILAAFSEVYRVHPHADLTTHEFISYVDEV